MDEYLDFFNKYIMGVIEMSFQFYFLVKIQRKKLWPPFSFLFGVCAVIVTSFLSVGTVTGFVAIVFFLTVCEILVCHADFKPSLLYATLTTEIMLLCYGIVKSLIGLLYAWLIYFFYDTAGIAVMLVSEAASLLLTGVCYYMVYHYFSRKSRAECRREKSRRCVECYFAGSQTGAIASLLQSASLTEEQIKELEALLEENKRKGEE